MLRHLMGAVRTKGSSIVGMVDDSSSEDECFFYVIGAVCAKGSKNEFFFEFLLAIPSRHGRVITLQVPTFAQTVETKRIRRPGEIVVVKGFERVENPGRFIVV